MKRQTFDTFIRKQKHREDATGDFARDWIADSGSKPKVRETSPDPLFRYLDRHNAIPEAYAAAYQSFREWKLANNPNPSFWDTVTRVEYSLRLDGNIMEKAGLTIEDDNDFRFDPA